MKDITESALTKAGGGPAVPFKLLPVTPGDIDPSDEEAKKKRTVNPLPWGRVYQTPEGLSFGEWLKRKTQG